MNIRLHRHLKQHLSAFEKNFEKAQEKSSKRNIHALRVSIKRLHALLHFAEFISPETVHAKKTYKKIKPLFTEAGKLRTLHTHLALLKEIKKQNDRVGSEIKKRKEKMYRQAADLEKELYRFPFKKKKAQLKTVFRHIRSLDEKQLLKRAFAFIALKFRSALKFADKKDFHGARKELKQAHYVLELFPFHKSASALLVLIDPLEKKAGRWHDIRDILRCTDKTLRQVLEKHFMQELKSLAAQMTTDFRKAESEFSQRGI